MRLEDACISYFNGFHEIANYSQNDCETNVFACLKIGSYFFVAPLIVMGCLYGADRIVRSCTSSSPEHQRVRNAAQIPVDPPLVSKPSEKRGGSPTEFKVTRSSETKGASSSTISEKTRLPEKKAESSNEGTRRSETREASSTSIEIGASEYLDRIQEIEKVQTSAGLVDIAAKNLDNTYIKQKLKTARDEKVTSTRVRIYCDLAKELIQLQKHVAINILDVAADSINDAKIEAYCEIAKVRLMIDPNTVPKELNRADSILEGARQNKLLPAYIGDLCCLAVTYHFAKKPDMANEKLKIAIQCAKSDTTATMEYLNNLCCIARVQIIIGCREEVKSTLLEMEYKISDLKEPKAEILQFLTVAKLWHSIGNIRAKDLIVQVKQWFSARFRISFDHYFELKKLDDSLGVFYSELGKAQGRMARGEDKKNPSKFSFNRDAFLNLSWQEAAKKGLSYAQESLKCGDIGTAEQLYKEANALFVRNAPQPGATIQSCNTSYQAILEAETIINKES